VYVAEARGEPAAGDDAAAIVVAAPESPPPLAFDHARILQDYLRTARRRCRACSDKLVRAAVAPRRRDARGWQPAGVAQ